MEQIRHPQNATRHGEEVFRGARKIVGISLAKNARWFFSWCQRDIRKLFPSERVLLWYELLALSLLASRTRQDLLAPELTEKERKVWEWATRWAEEFRAPPKNQMYRDWWEAIQNLHEEIRVCLWDVADRGRTRIRLNNNVEVEIMPDGIRPMFAPTLGSSFRWRDLINISQGALLRFVQTVQHFAGRIHRCPRCRMIFLASRRDQRSCSVNCRMAVVMQHRRERIRQENRSKKVPRVLGENHSLSRKGKSN